MNDLFGRRGDTLALAAGALLGLVIIASYVLGIGSIAQNLELALNPDRSATPPPIYNLDAASKLDLKGLTPGR
jgi:hypothetical protein